MHAFANHPSPALLRRLNALAACSRETLQKIAAATQIASAARGTVLLDLGSQERSMLFLLDGTVDLIAQDGGRKRIAHTSPSAASAIASLRPSRYQVVAASPVQYLRIDDSLLSLVVDSAGTSVPAVGDEFSLAEPGRPGATNRLTLYIYDQLDKGKLLLPSLPDVAVKVGSAINEDTVDARRMADLIEADPVIAAKIVKAANSPLYAGVREIGSIVDAVTRLGMRTTHHLVVALTLRELFRSDSIILHRLMHRLWTHSRKIAAICHVMARHIRKFDPEVALLAGLVHDIGTVAVPAYAREFPEIAEDERQLLSTNEYLRGRLGQLILTKWRMPVELASVAADAENWLRKHAGAADYSDLVIVAQLHNMADEPADFTRPRVQQTPAFQKLGLNYDEEQSQLTILAEASEEIHQLEALLGG